MPAAPLILFLVLVTGCSATLEELTEDARASGDWSAVDARLDRMEARKRERPESCSGNQRMWCDDPYDKSACRCMDNDAADAALREIWRRERRP